MAYNPNVPEPTNLVQDDIAAMRENFQHLDPLAQIVGELQAVSGLASVVEELQAVSGLAPVANELQAVSELAPYVQALLDSRIVDHNLDVADPPNGYYVRVDNGLQVAITRWETTINLQGDTLLEVQWSYPAVFTTVVFVAGETTVEGMDLNVISAVSTKIRRTSTSTLDAILRNSSSVDRIVRPRFLAIGRWT